MKTDAIRKCIALSYDDNPVTATAEAFAELAAIEELVLRPINTSDLARLRSAYNILANTMAGTTEQRVIIFSSLSELIEEVAAKVSCEEA